MWRVPFRRANSFCNYFYDFCNVSDDDETVCVCVCVDLDIMRYGCVHTPIAWHCATIQCSHYTYVVRIYV